jgi:hypothetical protein
VSAGKRARAREIGGERARAWESKGQPRGGARESEGGARERATARECNWVRERARETGRREEEGERGRAREGERGRARESEEEQGSGIPGVARRRRRRRRRR